MKNIAALFLFVCSTSAFASLPQPGENALVLSSGIEGVVISSTAEKVEVIISEDEGVRTVLTLSPSEVSRAISCAKDICAGDRVSSVDVQGPQIVENVFENGSALVRPEMVSNFQPINDARVLPLSALQKLAL